MSVHSTRCLDLVIFISSRVADRRESIISTVISLLWNTNSPVLSAVNSSTLALSELIRIVLSPFAHGNWWSSQVRSLAHNPKNDHIYFLFHWRPSGLYFLCTTSPGHPVIHALKKRRTRFSLNMGGCPIYLPVEIWLARRLSLGVSGTVNVSFRICWTLLAVTEDDIRT